jgi:hypothetical protein
LQLTDSPLTSGAPDPVSDAVGDLEHLARILAGIADAHVELVMSLDTLLGRPGSVAEVPGYGFISGEHARELAAGEGSVWHRIITDPVDGRCIERSTTAYRPDRRMRDQIEAVDRTCRAPGCTAPASRCQPDHETPYGAAGGITSETNLDLKHGPHHWLKTGRLWSSCLDALSRKVTWQSLFGRLYRTDPHDYRGYHAAPAPSGPTGGARMPTQHPQPSDRQRHQLLTRERLLVMRYDSAVLDRTARALETVRRDDDGHLVVTVTGPQTDPEGSAQLPDEAEQGHTMDLAQLLYASLARHEPSSIIADDLEAAWALPVDTAHRRGNQTRRGTPHHHVPVEEQLRLGDDSPSEEPPREETPPDDIPPPF